MNGYQGKWHSSHKLKINGFSAITYIKFLVSLLSLMDPLIMTNYQLNIGKYQNTPCLSLCLLD